MTGRDTGPTDEEMRAYALKLRAGYIVCAIFQCEEPPVWRDEDGKLLCDLHKPGA